MAYSDPATLAQGQLVTPDIWHREVRDNMAAVAAKGITYMIRNPAGGAIVPGPVGPNIDVPYSCKPVGWSIQADQAGSIQLDVWRGAWPGPGYIAGTIVGSEPPVLVAAQANRDLSLSTWDTDLDAGDVLTINVDSAATVEVVALTLLLVPR